MANSRYAFVRAFSLVELLFVISLISLLVSLLIPILANAREAARQTVCLSNLRVVGQSMFMYANKNRGWGPSFMGTVPEVGTESLKTQPANSVVPKIAWTHRLGSYSIAIDSKVWTCPAFAEESVITYFLSIREATLANQTAARISLVRNPSKFIVSGECTRVAPYIAPIGTANLTGDDLDKDDAMMNSLLVQTPFVSQF